VPHVYHLIDTQLGGGLKSGLSSSVLGVIGAIERIANDEGSDSAVIDQHIRLAGVQGFATGLGGLVTLPVLLPANLTGIAIVLACGIAMAMLSARQLTNQIDYVVLSMDFPYRLVRTLIIGTNVVGEEPNSTTSGLHYGYKGDTNPPCSMAADSTSLYAGSEGIFRLTPPLNSVSNSFLVTMITSSNLAQAKMIVDQGVNSDSTFPTQTVYLGKSTDPLRNIRFVHFDNTAFDFRVRGNVAIQRTNVNGPTGLGYMRGYQNGDAVASVLPNTFAPGSMVDELTSYGGLLFENGGQTPLLQAFEHAHVG
jgi:hypothetical protein